MQRPFIIVSGLPGSGKTRLGTRLAAVFHLPLIDKDDILEGLFESHGVGDSIWRRRLSRKSDVIFRRRASASDGAVLVSFWHLPGMDSHLGTPTDWLPNLSDQIIQLHCRCSPEIAARRFFRRNRHPGHLDPSKSYSDVLTGVRQLSLLEGLNIGAFIDVDTSQEPDLEAVVNKVRGALSDDD